MAKTTIPGGYIETGSIDTASLADTSITADKLHTTLDLTGKAVTVATATAGDNDTTVASTAFVSTAIANLAPLASPDFTGDATFDTSTLVIDSTNNRVGIGITAPDKILHIKTAVNNTAFARIESTATDSYPTLSLKNDAREYQLTAHGPLGDKFTIYDGTAGAHRFVIDSSGNVGIGTSSPAAGLQISKGLTNAGGPAAGASTASACFGNEGSDDNYGLVLGADGFGKGYISAQRTDGTATTYDLLIQPNGGNVGIGTSSTNSFKTYIDAASGKGLFVEAGDGGYTALGFDGDALSTKGSITSNNGRILIGSENSAGTGSDGELQIIPGTGNVMALDGPNGRVGIGTENPSAKLEVRPTNNVNLLVGNTGSELELTSGTNGGTYGAIANHQAHTHNFLTDGGSGTFVERMALNSRGPVLPAGDFGYHTTQERYNSSSGPSSYSTATNVTYTSATEYWPDKGEKLICLVNARAYTKYIHIKTNLTANNIMFYFRTKGYFYSYGCEEQLIGGYTYSSGGNIVIQKDNQTVAGNSHSGDTYRASDGSLVLKMDINQTGYTEGRMLVFFHAHGATTTSAITVTAVTQKDDGTNAF